MINTFSTFYFGIPEITIDNRNIPFNEGAGEVNAQVAVGSYSLDEFRVAIQTALNAASITLIFTVAVDRDSRKITISADGAFDLLILTGTTIGQSVFIEMGFTGSLDLTSLTTYTGDTGAGIEFQPQFKFQSFIDKADFQESADASVNISTSGVVEVVRFGLIKFYEFDLKFITDTPMDGKVIKSNPNGVANARTFLQDITLRKPFELMLDIADKSTFDKVILEKIPGNSTATGYKLKELFTRNLPGVFETGVIKLRVIV